MSLAIPHKVFITGTNTGVGKTVVSAAILLEAARRGDLPAAYLKPVQTGSPAGQGDVAFVKRALAEAGLEIDAAAVYELEDALAPAIAAELAGVTLDSNLVKATYELISHAKKTVVVEGAGGLLVPFTSEMLIADIVSLLDLPMLIVASPDLGTLNHTRLTVEAARARNLEVVGLVLSPWPAHPGIVEETNRARISTFCGLPLIGVVDEISGLDTDQPAGLASLGELAIRN